MITPRSRLRYLASIITAEEAVILIVKVGVFFKVFETRQNLNSSSLKFAQTTMQRVAGILTNVDTRKSVLLLCQKLKLIKWLKRM